MADVDPCPIQVTLPPNLGRSQSLEAMLSQWHLCRVWMDRSNLVKQRKSRNFQTTSGMKTYIFRESGFQVSHMEASTSQKKTSSYLIMILTYEGWTHSSFTGGVILTTTTEN